MTDPVAVIRELLHEARKTVCEPRRFHENEDSRQQTLSQAAVAAAAALDALVAERDDALGESDLLKLSVGRLGKRAKQAEADAKTFRFEWEQERQERKKAEAERDALKVELDNAREYWSDRCIKVEAELDEWIDRSSGWKHTADRLRAERDALRELVQEAADDPHSQLALGLIERMRAALADVPAGDEE